MNEAHNTSMMVLQRNVSGFLEQAEKEEAVFKGIEKRNMHSCTGRRPNRIVFHDRVV